MKTLIRTNKITPRGGATNIELIPVTSPDNEIHIAGTLVIDVFGDAALLFQPHTTYVLDISAQTIEASALTATEPEQTEQLTETTDNLNSNQMSIFSKIGDFFASLFDSIKKEYEKLDPAIKADITTAITTVNIIKANLDKPASELLALLESTIGGFATDKVKAVIEQVATDLGLAATVAGDPVSVLEAIVTALTGATGNRLLDLLLDTAKYLVVNLNPGDITRENGGPLVQWVKTHFFKSEVPAVG
jgi:hypothetical protein